MNAEEHDRMGHMTSDKRKRHLEEHPLVDKADDAAFEGYCRQEEHDPEDTE